MIGFLNASNFSAHVPTLALLGDDADPRMVALFCNMLSCSFTCTINILCFFRVLDRLMHPLEVSGDTSEDMETSIIWHITCRFGLGTLVGVCSAWVLIDFCYYLFIGLDEGHIKYKASMLMGVIMVSLIFQFWSSKNHRQVTLFRSLVKRNEFAGTTSVSSSAGKHGTVDPVSMWCAGEVHSDTLVSIV
jgi:hypothetical protein